MRTSNICLITCTELVELLMSNLVNAEKMVSEGTFRSEFLFALGTIECNSAFVVHVMSQTAHSRERSLTLVTLERQDLMFFQSYIKEVLLPFI